MMEAIRTIFAAIGGIAVGLVLLVMYCCLCVASDADDRMEQEQDEGRAQD